MCYAKPGPRCSTHAAASLVAGKNKLKVLQFEYERLRKEYHNPYSQDEVTSEQYEKLSEQRKRITDKKADIDTLRLDYYGTNEGQRVITSWIGKKKLTSSAPGSSLSSHEVLMDYAAACRERHDTRRELYEASRNHSLSSATTAVFSSNISRLDNFTSARAKALLDSVESSLPPEHEIGVKKKLNSKVAVKQTQQEVTLRKEKFDKEWDDGMRKARKAVAVMEKEHYSSSLYKKSLSYTCDTDHGREITIPSKKTRKNTKGALSKITSVLRPKPKVRGVKVPDEIANQAKKLTSILEASYEFSPDQARKLLTQLSSKDEITYLPRLSREVADDLIGVTSKHNLPDLHHYLTKYRTHL